MARIDAYYTPSQLAVQMVNACSGRPAVIADFAAGDGELLRKASKQWPRAKLIATDISKSALNALCDSVRVTEATRCNFLSQRSRSKCSALKTWAGGIDLVLLNPPFSCRGGRRVSVSTDHFEVACSTAMAFVLHAFGYLHSHGEIVAILPAGSLTSEKDREAWHQLRKHASVDIISHHDHKTFGDCFPTTRLVHIKRTDSAGSPKPKKACHTRPLRTDDPVIIHRGTIQMHSIPKGKSPLAHSTDVSDFRITLNGHKAKAGHSAVSGHFVAICRVGDPKKEKVALHYSRSEVAISDCLVALCCSNKANARDLHSQIVRNWPKLAILYGGTGAKYITISKLATFIRQLGFSVAPHANAKSQLRRLVAEYS